MPTGFRCRIVQRISGTSHEDDCPVTEDACAACCRCAEPTEEHPNEVIASLAHSRISHRLSTARSPRDFVRATEQLVWIERFLHSENPNRNSADPMVAGKSKNVTPASRRSGWTGWFNSWRPRIGLVGTNNLKGLGHLNRDIARWLPVDQWLIPGPAKGTSPPQHGRGCRRDFLNHQQNPQTFVRDWLRGIDALLFVERPSIPGLTALARQAGVFVICVPTWEWLHPGLDWLGDVDLMLCPTQFTERILKDWKERFRFPWEVRHQSWPVDLQAFAFRQRRKCDRFVFINGTDQRLPLRSDGRPTATRRKGLEVLIDAAKRLPHIPFIVWSQTDSLPPLPRNIELRRSAINNSELYEAGDVCVQLSRWEGLGLPLLECQAAGLPLITTDAAPMHEYHPLDVVPVSEEEAIALWPRRHIVAPVVQAEDAARVLESWFGRDIRDASRAAREFIEQEHSWNAAQPTLRQLILDQCARRR